MEYDYSTGDVLASPHTYFFSHGGGKVFLKAYFSSRATAIMQLEQELLPDALGPCSADNWVLSEWRKWIEEAPQDSAPQSLLTFMKRFAVTKRIWTDYTRDVRPTSKARYDDLSFYCVTSHLSLQTAKVSSDPRFLNIALQINDILIAHRADLAKSQIASTFAVIHEEVSQVFTLMWTNVA